MKHDGKEIMQLFEGEHFLNDKVLSKVVMPLVETTLSNSPITGEDWT